MPGAASIPSKYNAFKAALAVNDVEFTIGDEASNIINVALQFKGPDLNDATQRVSVTAYLSDDEDGSSVAGTAPTTVAIGTDGVAIPLVTGKCFQLISEEDGTLDLDVTLSSGADTFYLVVVMPDGSLKVSEEITFAA